jgi:hypothetical protein
MTKGLYSIYDKKAGLYSPPQAHVTKSVMVRNVTDLIREGNNQIANHPEDFTIVQVGLWHEITGSVEEHSEEICECDILVGEK